ncbi:MAG: glycosyltransferase family 9 protein [Gemmatimonadetes bacterium]|nr:glycosyltransferase family 9 protein [Gemmatimonadota bacterium]
MADLVVRAPNHLGDLVLALPALERAGGDVLVVEPLAPLVAQAGPPGRVLPLRRGVPGFWRAAGALRAAGYRQGILLSPAFSAALLLRAGGVREVRGTATDGRAPLLTEAVDPGGLRGRHRALQYLELVGGVPRLPESPFLTPPASEIQQWRGRLAQGGRRVVGVAPGSRASSRQWAPERFRALVERLCESGHGVAVFGSPDERRLTGYVSGLGERAVDVGGRTELPALAAALAACDLVVANDSGTMHLAAAVGTPTLSVWGPGDPVETAPLGRGHRRIVHSELSCVPCVKNRCPRSGRGEILERAERECMALAAVDEVFAAALEMLEGRTATWEATPESGR